MGRRFPAEVAIEAGAQFLGTEFRVQVPGRPRSARDVRSINLHMGAEPKSWRVEKVTAGGDRHLLRQSLDAQGAPAANTDTDVFLYGEEAGGRLEAGEQIQVTTSGADEAMSCRQEFEEV